MIEIEDFLEDYEGFREHVESISYEGVKSPYDGVVYPDVSIDIPEEVFKEVKGKLEALFKAEVEVNAMFLRLSTEGVHVPHQAHHDLLMGDYSLMLYLGRREIGGTSFLKHTELGYTDESIPKEVFERDTNLKDKWEIVGMCQAKPNKACIFDAGTLHRAEPVGGYGSSVEDGRLVLTAFFEVKDDKEV